MKSYIAISIADPRPETNPSEKLKACGGKSKTTPEVLAGLEAAAEYGTARLASPRGIKVAGKTGTSLDAAAGQAHAWFAGFAPADAPRVALVVFLEQGTGARDAAPVARALFEAALPLF